jgi:tetratricopeptide (TPR) repeat protein
MKIQRQAITAAALLAVVFAPKMAVAQRPTARVPIFLAVTFRSPGEPKLGLETSEAIRQRMLRFFPMPPLKTLRTLKLEEINGALTGSGYPADSAITTSDLRDLSKQLGADEAMEGTVKRTAQGVEAHARFYYGSNVNAPEVLPPVVDKDASAVGRKIAELYVQARKELPAYERCKNALIQNNPDAAIVAAKEAMQQYAQGILPRACLLTAYGAQYKKFPADSTIRLGNEIMAIDPDNAIAITELVNAYRAKNDTAKAIEMSMKLYALNPNDMQQARSIIDFLMASGAPDKALTLVQDQMKQNPGEASIIETQWKIFQNTNQWKQAIASGEEMVKFDTSKADTIYFRRQVGAALQDSQPQLALQFLARAVQKFPKNVFFLQAYSTKLKEAGQVQQALEQAKKVLAVDPKAPQGYATVVSLYTQVGQPDSAVAFAKQALAANPDSSTKDQIGKGLLALIAPAMSKAQTDTGAAIPAETQKGNWAQVLKLSASVDSIAPTPNTAFYMSVAAYYVAQHGLANLGEVAKTNKPQACTMLKEASDNLLIVDLNMARGGRVDPRTAAALLQATSGTLKPYIDTAKKQLACK